MARPKKNNADYFTHDADMRNDLKVKAVRRKFGHVGYAVWNYLLEVMTDNDYFEIDWSELNQELLSADFDLPVEELQEIVDYCVRLGLLKLDDGKLFSEALQRRFSGLLSKRKRQSERVTDGENEGKKEFSTTETTNERVFDGENPQSKVKESKVNIILSDNDSDTHPDGCSSDPPKKESVKKPSGKKQPAAKRFIPPTLQQVEEYCRERRNRVSPIKFFNYYTSNGWRVGKNPMKDWKAAVRTWENNDYDNGNQHRSNPGASVPANGHFSDDL